MAIKGTNIHRLSPKTVRDHLFRATLEPTVEMIVRKRLLKFKSKLDRINEPLFEGDLRELKENLTLDEEADFNLTWTRALATSEKQVATTRRAILSGSYRDWMKVAARKVCDFFSIK